MSRSVVLAGTVRCDRCRLPPRWCVCQALEPVTGPFPIDILTHHREESRPSSTGRLIERVVTGSRRHIYYRRAPHLRVDLASPGSELWLLHPRGEPLASVAPPAPAPGGMRIVLLDGSWTEAATMLRAVEGRGRTVSLPLAEESRYWLRDQHHAGQLSTVEALLGVFRALHYPEAEARLRLHFELHVYASLRARGRSHEAAAYLETSPIRLALPEVLSRLLERRPNPLAAVPRP